MFKKNTLAALIAVNTVALPAFAEEADKAGKYEEVVVTATLTVRDSASTPAFTSVITAEDIARAPANSLADLLRDTVGVNNRSDGAGRDEIQIRGMGGRYTLVLVDGKRVSSSSALWRGGDFDLSSIPMGSIERVEVVRGPMAALYGSDAIGGVVNIITKAPTNDWQGSLAAEYRTVKAGDKGQQKRFNGSVAGAISDRVSLSLSGEVYERDAWYRYDASDAFEVPALEAKESKSLIASSRIKLNESQSLDVDLSYSNDDRPYGIYSRWGDYREQGIERVTFGLTHDANWDWGKSVVFLKQEDSEINDFNSAFNDPQYRITEEQNTYFKAYASTELGIQAITGGIDFRNQEVTDAVAYVQTGSESVTTLALFVQDEIALTDQFSLTLGGRVDDHESLGNHFSPKVYLTYALSDSVVLKGGVSRAFKAPDTYQMSEEFKFISCGGGCFIYGEPDLDAETSTNIEAGIEVREAGWRLSAAVFDNEVEDMISPLFDGDNRYWVNLDEARTRGIELDASVALSETVTFSGNATYLTEAETSWLGTPVKLENRPDLMVNLSASWQLTDALGSSISFNHVGDQYDYRENVLPAYTRVDLTGSYRVTDALEVNFGVKNATDVDLLEESPNFNVRELGRNYYMSANYAF